MNISKMIYETVFEKIEFENLLNIGIRIGLCRSDKSIESYFTIKCKIKFSHFTFHLQKKKKKKKKKKTELNTFS